MKIIWKKYGVASVCVFFSGIVYFFESLLLGPFGFIVGIEMMQLRNYAAALLVFSLSWLLARYVRLGLVHGTLERRSGQPMPILLGDFAFWGVMLLGVIIILTSVFDKNISAVLATGGIGIAVMGFSLKEVIASIFNGLILNLENPFKIGDFIEYKGQFGTVAEINWRSTRIKTLDGNVISAPNSNIANADIINWSLPNSTWLKTLQVYIDSDTSVESAERILLSATLATSGVLSDPKPLVWAKRIERDGVLYEIRYWVDWMKKSHFKTTHYLVMSILERLRDAQVSISYSKSEVLFTRNRSRIADHTLDKVILVSQIDLFREFHRKLHTQIADNLEEMHVIAGQSAIKKGEQPDALFIVGEGLLYRMRYDYSDQPPIRERFVATEYFGQHSLFFGDSCETTVFAETNALLYVLRKNVIADVLNTNARMVGAIANELANHQLIVLFQQEQRPAVLQAAHKRLHRQYVGEMLARYQITDAGVFAEDTPDFKNWDSLISNKWKGEAPDDADNYDLD